jgi:hypothetical protein
MEARCTRQLNTDMQRVVEGAKGSRVDYRCHVEVVWGLRSRFIVAGRLSIISQEKNQRISRRSITYLNNGIPVAGVTSHHHPLWTSHGNDEEGA